MSDSIKDISKLKVADLKRELKNRGLSSVGNKQELQDRLQMALQDGTDSALLLDDTGPVDTEDILNEDDVLADEEDSNTNAASDGGNVTLKRHIEDELEEDNVTHTTTAKSATGRGQDNGPPTKKITLNRKALAAQVPTGPSEKPQPEVEEKPKIEASNEGGEKKVVKLSALSMNERLALRAAKFNLPPSESSKKESRSARFGGVSTPSVTPATPEVNIDTLKKRAERFGVQPGSKIELVELEERKKKRLERFGGVSVAANGSAPKAATAVAPAVTKPGRIPITAPSSSNTEDKKRLRAERFKTIPSN